MRTSRGGSEPGSRAPAPAEHGTSMIELVIVLSLVFLPLIWGLITFGYAFSVRENLTHSAQEALRRSVIGAQTAGMTNAQVECQALSEARSRMATIVGSHNGASSSGLTASETRCGTSAVAAGGLDIGTNYIPGAPDGSFPLCVDSGGAQIPGSSCVTVTLAYQYGKYPVISPLPGIFDLIPSTLRISATERIG